MVSNRQVWPEGKEFAVAIFDDTDLATLDNVPPVYALLRDLGFRTTKSIWPMRGPDRLHYPGLTGENRNYLRWIRELLAAGFEIGYHGATFHGSRRPQITMALEKFNELIGHNPYSMSNHSECTENIYWGDHRLSGVHRLAYNLLTGFRNRNRFRGHIEGDEYFWGDLCQDKITYLRNFVYSEINTLKACPWMPYHDPRRPYVNYWYASANGRWVNHFNSLLSEANQDQLEEEGGASIIYTHFACGFYEQGAIDPRFQELITRLSRKNGWFVPVATLLDYLLQQNGHHVITAAQRRRLERKWLLQKLVVRSS